jgi:hypothetical protein
MDVEDSSKGQELTLVRTSETESVGGKSTTEFNIWTFTRRHLTAMGACFIMIFASLFLPNVADTASMRLGFLSPSVPTASAAVSSEEARTVHPKPRTPNPTPHTPKSTPHSLNPRPSTL